MARGLSGGDVEEKYTKPTTNVFDFFNSMVIINTTLNGHNNQNVQYLLPMATIVPFSQLVFSQQIFSKFVFEKLTWHWPCEQWGQSVFLEKNALNSLSIYPIKISQTELSPLHKR